MPFNLKTLAALMIAIWSAHLPMCALADEHARSSAHHEQAPAAGHGHGDSHDSPGGGSGQEESCVDHCQQLMQGVPKSGPSVDLSIGNSDLVLLIPWDAAARSAAVERAIEVRHDRAPPVIPLRRDVLRL